jgi:hypothetical protein
MVDGIETIVERRKSVVVFQRNAQLRVVGVLHMAYVETISASNVNSELWNSLSRRQQPFICPLYELYV